MRGVGEPFAAARHGLALLSDVAALLEEIGRAVSLASTGQLGGAAGGGELLQRVDEQAATPCPAAPDAHRACRSSRRPSARRNRRASSAASPPASAGRRAVCRTLPRPRPRTPRLPAAPRCNRRRSVPRWLAAKDSPPASALSAGEIGPQARLGQRWPSLKMLQQFQRAGHRRDHPGGTVLAYP